MSARCQTHRYTACADPPPSLWGDAQPAFAAKAIATLRARHDALEALLLEWANRETCDPDSGECWVCRDHGPESTCLWMRTRQLLGIGGAS